MRKTCFRHCLLILAMFFLFGASLLACDSPNPALVQRSEGDILFKDDFSDTSSGWDQIDTAEGITNYTQDAYRIKVNQSNTDVWANPNLEFADVRIEVEVTKAGGPDDNSFGVICRSDASGDHYYFFIISSDGYYGIGKVINDQQFLLTGEQMLPHEIIRQGDETNSIRVDCVGEQLSFYINGELVDGISDGEYMSGDIGLTAGTFKQPGVDIYFDNLRVLQP